MALGDGNGWVLCRCGHRHWGRFGAAGLLLVRHRPAAEVLLQLRAGWTHEGGSWGLLGGARDSHESIAEAALREAAEEGAVEPASVRVLGEQVGADHGDWRYTYVLGITRVDVQPRVMTDESEALRWVPLAAAEKLSLHSGLRRAWERLAPWIDESLERSNGRR